MKLEIKKRKEIFAECIENDVDWEDTLYIKNNSEKFANQQYVLLDSLPRFTNWEIHYLNQLCSNLCLDNESDSSRHQATALSKVLSFIDVIEVRKEK